MPPFSRGICRLLRHAPVNAFSTGRPFPLAPKPGSKKPLSWRSTRKVTPPPPHSPPSVGTSRRSRPFYVFAALRSNVASTSANLTKVVRKQYRRVPLSIRRILGSISRLAIILVFILPPLTVVRNHWFDIIKVTGPSMSPYLNTDLDDVQTDVHNVTKFSDRILLDLYCPGQGLERGMVVALRTPHDPEKWAIKRIVGVQGDRVFPLAHYPGCAALEGKGLIVPFGHVWVEGDVSDSNKKDVSLDSNIYGPISIGLITGKAVYVITSLFRRWIPVDWRDFKLPERVHIGASQLRHPDEEYQTVEFERLFHNGKAEELLQFLKATLQDGDDIEACRSDVAMVDFLLFIRRHANLSLQKRERMGDDSRAKGLTADLLDYVHIVVGAEEEEEHVKTPSMEQAGTQT